MELACDQAQMNKGIVSLSVGKSFLAGWAIMMRYLCQARFYALHATLKLHSSIDKMGLLCYIPYIYMCVVATRRHSQTQSLGLVVHAQSAALSTGK